MQQRSDPAKINWQHIWMGAAETVLHLTGNRASRALTEARITVSTAWTVMFEDQYRYLTTGEKSHEYVNQASYRTVQRALTYSTWETSFVDLVAKLAGTR